MFVYPVQPTRLQSGAIAALTQFLDETESMPIPLKASDKPFSSFRVAAEEISLQVAAKLDVAAVFKGSFQFSDMGLVFDAVAYTDKYLPDPGDAAVIMTRWGAGMRVAMKITDIQGSLSASFGAVAASAELNLAKASYEILGLGLGLEAFSAILGGLPAMGEFGLEAYAKLTRTVYGALKDYIEQHQADLIPVPLAVGLREEMDTDPVVEARSVYLAAHWRDRNKSEAWVLERYPYLDAELVHRVYELPYDAVMKWLEL